MKKARFRIKSEGENRVTVLFEGTSFQFYACDLFDLRAFLGGDEGVVKVSHEQPDCWHIKIIALESPDDIADAMFRYCFSPLNHGGSTLFDNYAHDRSLLSMINSAGMSTEDLLTVGTLYVALADSEA